jgi:hypothetical protein
MAKENVAQGNLASVKRSLTEMDMTVQHAQKEGAALLAGIQALISDKDCTNRTNIQSADVLCERLDGILFSLMNDINCMAEQHGAHFSGDVHVH